MLQRKYLDIQQTDKSEHISSAIAVDKNKAEVHVLIWLT